MKEMVGGCCVCSDDRGWPENPLVYCDGQSCTVAVHQACYGIVTVPTGPWYCRKCESQERSVKVKCELCPSRHGALKRTDNTGWAHVVCALYIPEVRFGNVSTMEPILLHLIPQERYSKVCYICKENNKTANASVGACMQCNKSGCKQQFHVTCAQSLGLLCEEAGNYLDNVKYCGYCQYHYGKLKKGINIKTIPPYKPVSTENIQSDSSSEKELDSGGKPAAAATTSPPAAPTTKRKSSAAKASAAKNSEVSTTAPVPPFSQQQQQQQQPSQKSTVQQAPLAPAAAPTTVIPTKVPSKSVTGKSKDEHTGAAEESKKEEDAPPPTKEPPPPAKAKKRKANSRTPTPSVSSDSANVSDSAAPTAVQKKESPHRTDISADKAKKAKTDSSPLHVTASAAAEQVNITTASTTTAPTASIAAPVVPEPSMLTANVPLAAPPPIIQATANSVVVSVPLQNTSLSPRPNVGASFAPKEDNASKIVPTPVINTIPPEPSPAPPAVLEFPEPIEEENKMLTSEVIASTGGLKITFEKQPGTAMELDEVAPSAPVVDGPAKRSRSQSTEKVEKITRSAKKKNSNGLMNSAQSAIAATVPKRSSRSQHNTPPPTVSTNSVFAGISQSANQIKDSPPSSPSSESLGGPPVTRRKARKSAPASVSNAGASGSSSQKDVKETKDIKLFQNGINAPHMLGNQLNLNSNMAQKMTDHLNSELEAHSIYSNESSSSTLMGPQLHHRVATSARSNSTGGSSTASAGSGLSSMLGGGGAIPQTLDQLLERQWEQGSQFLMEQAQHFDIASLLSCLHQLRNENMRLEEHVSSLQQRRDHLLAVNARLAIPLPALSQSSHSHTVNNIHPSAASHPDLSRTRHSSASYSQNVPMTIENGIAPGESNYSSLPHRSPVGAQSQSSSNIRQSFSGVSDGRTSRGPTQQQSQQQQHQQQQQQQQQQPSQQPSGSRPSSHGYPLYPGATSTPPSGSQQQMVIRRESEHSGSKTS